jgi:hypothetical protein
MLVPDSTLESVSLVIAADVMFTPAFKRARTA